MQVYSPLKKKKEEEVQSSTEKTLESTFFFGLGLNKETSAPSTKDSHFALVIGYMSWVGRGEKLLIRLKKGDGLIAHVIHQTILESCVPFGAT